MTKIFLPFLIIVFSLNSCTKKIAEIPTEKEKEILNPTTNILDVNFENTRLGNYSDELVKYDFKNIDWVSTKERGEITEETTDRSKVLKVKYPKGAVGPQETGIQFVRKLASAEEYYLDYYVKFDENFDFALGGKLPGLTSGGATYTGGVHPENGEGWSARYMWQGNGKPIVYLYYVDMKEKWGEIVNLGDAQFTKGKWHRLTQHIKLNTNSEENGILEVWFDGKKVVEKSTVKFRLGDLGKIDSFYFSTFHGGNTADWAPKNDCFTFFDNFVISTEKPNL